MWNLATLGGLAARGGDPRPGASSASTSSSRSRSSRCSSRSSDTRVELAVAARLGRPGARARPGPPGRPADPADGCRRQPARRAPDPRGTPRPRRSTSTTRHGRSHELLADGGGDGRGHVRLTLRGRGAAAPTCRTSGCGSCISCRSPCSHRSSRPTSRATRNEWGIRIAAAGVAALGGVEHASAVGRDRRRDERLLAAAHPVLTRPRASDAARGRSRRIPPPPSTPPSRSANDRSNPPARKIHASASGSRSAGIAPVGLISTHHLGDEVVYLAHVGAHVALDLLVLGRFGHALQPEVRQQRVRPRRTLSGAGARDGARPAPTDGALAARSPSRSSAPCLVEAREPQIRFDAK